MSVHCTIKLQIHLNYSLYYKQTDAPDQKTKSVFLPKVSHVWGDVRGLLALVELREREGAIWFGVQ